MKYDPNKHHRRSIRLKRYDYHNAGAYFIAICTINRACVLENLIVNSIINDIWLALPLWFPTIELDEFMIMPNRVHFVVWLGGLDANVGIPLAGILPENVGALNAQEDEGRPRLCAMPLPQNWIERNDVKRQAKFWQANYYEHIIRTDCELNAIRQYISENPNHWQTDRDNLNNINPLPPPSKMEDYLEELYELMGWKT
ncbi:MAG: hypothetical protein HXY38_14520 [Chloroflexi bacterium]|nr:hypothetical protein [Chloroflexota bacterium]